MAEIVSLREEEVETRGEKKAVQSLTLGFIAYR